jgi:hypothetical protein
VICYTCLLFTMILVHMIEKFHPCYICGRVMLDKLCKNVGFLGFLLETSICYLDFAPNKWGFAT